MAITFRHDAAAVALPSNSATRKYGQNLVLQQNQQKYAAQQAGYDCLFTMGRDQQQATAAAIRQGQQDAANTIRDVNQNVNAQARQDAQNKFLLEQQQAEQQQKFMDEGRKLSSGMIMEDIKNGMYDPVTARKLQQSLVDEAEVLGSNQYDATQRAEALKKIREKRLLDSTNRLEKPPQPTPDEEFQKGVATDPETGMRYRKNSKGDWDELKQQQKAPKSAAEAFAADPKLKDKYLKDARDILTADDRPISRGLLKEADDLAMQLWEDSNRPVGDGSTSSAGYYNAPDSGSPTPQQIPPAAAQTPANPPASSEEINADTPTPKGKQKVFESGGRGFYFRDRTPEEAVQGPATSVEITWDTPTSLGTETTAPTQEVAQPPADEPLPEYQAAMDQLPVPAKPQQVKVGGKPLAVTPGTLTPQETAARGQLMELPREQRIAALMPYEPSLKGKTLDQLLEDPQTKAGYEELKKQGLATGNYREDMLGHIDEMLQNNVLNAGSKPDAYVGMNVNDIKDPKAKAEIDKLPRPKSKNDRNTIRSGQMYVDPEGVIRARS